MPARASIDIGHGTPFVLIPGVQGRWEWMSRTVTALSRDFRVLSFSLAGEPASGMAIDPALGFDTFVAQIERALDDARLEQAIVCGVSYGGLIALRYATLHPNRVRALVLVSTPPPDFKPNPSQQRCLRAPHLMAPVFVAGAIRRGCREVMSALPTWSARAAFCADQVRQVLRAPMVPGRVRERVRLLGEVDFNSSARCCTVPTLLVTGEPELDRVVEVEGTLRYRQLLPDVTACRLRGTGHLGIVTCPDAFAAEIGSFLRTVERRRDPRRMLG